MLLKMRFANLQKKSHYKFNAPKNNEEYLEKTIMIQNISNVFRKYISGM